MSLPTPLIEKKEDITQTNIGIQENILTYEVLPES